jgi:hypothetical protein
MVAMMERKRILAMFNRFIAICYLSMAVLVGLKTVLGEVAAAGGIVLITFLVWQAFGHFRLKAWAPKVTAAISIVVNLMAIPYLFAFYESQLLPSFQQRLINFLLITLMTALLIFNYRFSEKLKYSG